jgi:hypothetical protein
MESDRHGHPICQDNLYIGLFITGPTRRQTQSIQTSADYSKSWGYIAQTFVILTAASHAIFVSFLSTLTPTVGYA